MDFITWLSNELDRRGWSQSQLAAKANLSRSLIAKTIKGDIQPSASLVIATAAALEESPVRLLRLAAILPPGSGDPAIDEVSDLMESLSPAQRRQVAQYVKFLKQSDFE